MIRDEPQSPALQREVAIVYFNIAVLSSSRGDKDEALRWYQKARDVQEKLFSEHKGDRELQHDLALSCRRIGDRLVRDGQVKEGMESLSRGHALTEGLAKANPGVIEYQWDLALSHRSLAHAHKAAGDKARAAASYREAIDLLRWAHRQDPSAATYARDLAATLGDLGLVLVGDKSKAGEALRAFAQAADLYRELAGSGSDTEALAKLGAACNDLGMMRRDLGRWEEALAAFTESRDAREALVRLRPDEPRYQDELAAAWFNVAQMQAHLKRRDEETRSYERSRQILERLVKDFPKNIAFHSA